MRNARGVSQKQWTEQCVWSYLEAFWNYIREIKEEQKSMHRKLNKKIEHGNIVTQVINKDPKQKYTESL